jgi:hypothetical protein
MRYIELLIFSAIFASVVYVFASVFGRYLFPRREMESKARALLAQHPDAEQTSVYLELHSMFAPAKQREIDAKIAEMQPQGWTFLRAIEASPLRTIRSRGGGLTLHFIRTKV